MFLISTCPYCNTQQIPFDVQGIHPRETQEQGCFLIFYFEIFTICRKCQNSTVFLISYQSETNLLDFETNSMENEYNYHLNLLNSSKDENLLNHFIISQIIRPPNNISYRCPEHVPKDIKEKFNEAAQCHANDCIVASSIMLRLCLETVTKDLLETEKEKEEKLHVQIKNLFKQGKIKEDIKDFADEIRLDGNYAVHEGKMNQENLQDLFEFTIALLEDIYTRKKRLELSRERRAQRKKPGTTT